jgi:uncharacterized protein (DUF1697 family)
MLRGLNVGGYNKVTMVSLKECYESLGFNKVRTYIQSGNVVFDHPPGDAPVVADRIRKGIKKGFGLDVQVIVRTKEEISGLIRNLPFKGLDQNKFHVTFLSDRPPAIPLKEIDSAKDSAERFSVAGREVYLFCPNGYGRTKLSNQFFEKKLNVYATTRNWRTVNALSELANS